MEKIINWSEMSRIIAGGDRNAIRQNKIPKKHFEALTVFFEKQLPEWWEQKKQELNKKSDT